MRQTSDKRAMSNESDDVAPNCAEELAALSEIVDGTAHSIGEEFFQILVRHLARSLDVNYAFVAEFASPETTTKAHHLLLGQGPHRREFRVDACGHAL